METKQRQKKWYEANKEYVAAVSREKYKKNREAILKCRAEQRANETPEAREKRLSYLQTYRSRSEAKAIEHGRRQTDEYKYKQYSSAAERRGYDFDLSFEYFCELFHGNCVYDGQVEARGIDRVDNAKGYTVENSVPCCEMCNKMKWKFGKEDFINHAKRIANFQK